MTKLRVPLLSFSASGTIAEALTFTRSPVGPRAQQIPTHPDARSLPQLYQRWKFRDCQFHWNDLTPTQQAAYAAARYPPHMTGQQRHTRKYLRDLTDLALWLPLDELSGTTAYDISRHLNHGTYLGTTTTPSIIANGRLFDGVDDLITLPDAPSNRPTGPITISLWVRSFFLAAPQFYLCKWTVPQRSFNFRHQAPNRLEFYISQDGTASVVAQAPLGLPSLHTWHHLAAVYLPSTYMDIYLDGERIFRRVAGVPPSIFPSTGPLVVSDPRHEIAGAVDDIRLYTRALSAHHIAYIYSQERYPLP